MHAALSNYKVIIFDWDGTLMDSAGHIVQAVQHAATDMGLPVPEAACVRRGIGTSFDAQYQRLFLLSDPVDERARDEAIYSGFRRAFYQHYDQGRPPLFAGVDLLLARLREQGYVLAIATSGTRSMLDSMLAAYALTGCFSHTYCGDEIAAKPAPDMLEAIVCDSGVEVRHAVMIGDSVYDIQAARNAGMDSIGVATGVSSSQALSEAGASVVLAAIDQLVC
jgi:phosphoglycolate phosphatase